MNCKPGDLAMVVKAVCPENIGLIVKVLRWAPPIDGMPAWETESDRPSPTVCTISPRVSTGMHRVADVRDAWLRPIRDPGDDAIDEMVQKLGKPEGVTA